MVRFFIERIVGLIAVLFAVSIVVFGLGSLIPGDLATVIAGVDGASEEQYQAIRDELGLNDPLPVQYGRWLGGVVQGDFGRSPITGRDVTTDLTRQIPVSLQLTGLGLLVSTLLGIPLGILAAVRANKATDVVIRATLLIVFSVPVFIVGVFLVLAASQWFTTLYTSVYVPFGESPTGFARSMFLPVLTITVPLAAMTMQMTRASMLEALQQPHILTADAKGAKRWSVLYVHALKNALQPVVTLLGFQFGILLGGLFVVEEIFSLPGLGRGLLVAIGQRDYPLVMATTMVFAFFFVLANIIVDFLYPVLDPRQRAAA
jgi:peptide/nickel transport system permease protein